MMIKALLLISLLMVGATCGFAKQGGAEMMFRGTLIESPACTINHGERVDVNFGERVGINKVNGVNYRMPVSYKIDCESEANGWVLMLSLKGSPAGFDKDALLTNKANLGIRIYQNGKPFTPDSALQIDLKNPPVLEAVPVKNAQAPLTEGMFEAWATLQTDYQ